MLRLETHVDVELAVRHGERLHAVGDERGQLGGVMQAFLMQLLRQRQRLLVMQGDRLVQVFMVAFLL